VGAHVDLATATKVALGSMMSTAQANLSVGPPYDLGVYRNDSLAVDEFRITPDSALLRRLQGVWEKHLTMAVADLPTIQDLEEHGEPMPRTISVLTSALVSVQRPPRRSGQPRGSRQPPRLSDQLGQFVVPDSGRPDHDPACAVRQQVPETLAGHPYRRVVASRLL
jgi:hypothetical protein